MLRSAVVSVVVAASAAVILAGCSTGTLPGASSAGSGTASTPKAASSHSSSTPAAPKATDSSSTDGTYAGTKSCPAASVVSSTLGIPVGDAAVTTIDKTLDCSYISTAQKTIVIMNFSTTTDTPDQLHAKFLAEATKAEAGSTLKQVPGLGQLAMVYQGPKGISALAVLANGQDFNIVAAASLDKLETMARTILAG